MKTLECQCFTYSSGRSNWVFYSNSCCCKGGRNCLHSYNNLKTCSSTCKWPMVWGNGKTAKLKTVFIWIQLNARWRFRLPFYFLFFRVFLSQIFLSPQDEKQSLVFHCSFFFSTAAYFKDGNSAICISLLLSVWVIALMLLKQLL